MNKVIAQVVAATLFCLTAIPAAHGRTIFANNLNSWPGGECFSDYDVTRNSFYQCGGDRWDHCLHGIRHPRLRARMSGALSVFKHELSLSRSDCLYDAAPVSDCAAADYAACYGGPPVTRCAAGYANTCGGNGYPSPCYPWY
jgi:hypothetical protein